MTGLRNSQQHSSSEQHKSQRSGDTSQCNAPERPKQSLFGPSRSGKSNLQTSYAETPVVIIPDSPPAPKISQPDEPNTNRSSRWGIKPANVEEANANKPSKTYSQPKPLEVARKIASNLRLKGIKKQLEKSHDSSVQQVASTKPAVVTQPRKPIIATAPLKSGIATAALTPVINKPTYSQGTKQNKFSQNSMVSGLPLPNPNLAHLQAQAMGFIPTPPVMQNLAMATLQAHALGVPHETMASIQAQAFASVQAQSAQAMNQPFVPANPWDTLGPNLMSVPDNMMGVPNNMLGVPDMLRVPDVIIPDNVVGVPEILGIQPEMFNVSSPLPILQNAPTTSIRTVFNLDEFEPPQFSSPKKFVKPKPTVTEKSPKKSLDLDSFCPPPGVDMEEYLREYKGNVIAA